MIGGVGNMLFSTCSQTWKWERSKDFFGEPLKDVISLRGQILVSKTDDDPPSLWHVSPTHTHHRPHHMHSHTQHHTQHHTETETERERKRETWEDERWKMKDERQETRQDKTRQDKTRQDKTRQDKTRQDKTRQDKTRQDKTRQDKTRQDKTRQDKTRQDEREDKTRRKRRQDKTRRKRREGKEREGKGREEKRRQDKTRQDKTREMKEEMILLKNVWNEKKTPDESAQNVSKKSLSDELFLIFPRKIRILPFFQLFTWFESDFSGRENQYRDILRTHSKAWSFAPRVHGCFLDEKHSAPWHYLCDESLSTSIDCNTWTLEGRSQCCSRGRRTALSRCLQRTWLPTSLRVFRSRRKYTTDHTSLTWWGR